MCFEHYNRSSAHLQQGTGLAGNFIHRNLVLNRTSTVSPGYMRLKSTVSENMTPAQDATATEAAKEAPAPSLAGVIDLPSQLKWYYSRLFPAQLFGRWLGYGADEYLSKREISFTLPGDIYLRWRSYNTTESLLAALKSQTPIKMDIGAVYNFPPKDRNMVTAALTPQAKELVFDIDLTDYDDVIVEADDGSSAVARCDRHWAYMATAVRVLDAALREDFGFNRIMWVYSGRRGIHGWVCDARARLLNNMQRAAVADYLVVRTSGRGAARGLGTPLHPALVRARRLCEATWTDHVLRTQGALDGENARTTLSDVLGEGMMRDGWLERAADERRGDPVQRWRTLENQLRSNSRHGPRAMSDFVVLRHTYPRLDVNVSKEINHLLKAPFCVHPKTSRVCIPFRASDAESFNPATHAPVVGKLIAEIGKEGPETAKMSEAVKVFDEFVADLQRDARIALRDEQLKRLDAKGAEELLAV